MCGDEIINGGFGNDVIDGGSGNDMFQFFFGVGGYDIIIGFSVGVVFEDMIEFVISQFVDFVVVLVVILDNGVDIIIVIDV